MYCVLSDDDGLVEERLFDRCKWKSARGFHRFEHKGAKPHRVLRIDSGRKVIGHGRRGFKSCSWIYVWIAGVGASRGEFLKVLDPDWREDLLIGAIALTVMAILDAAID